MSDWFKSKQAIIDLCVCFGAGSFAWFWFGEVIRFGGYVALVLGGFGIAQLARFVGAQLATLEWARMQEAGLPDKNAKVVMRRSGAGYRDAGFVEELPSPEAAADEAEIARRRWFAQRSLGVVGAMTALSTLVPGFAFGSWAIPVIFAALAVLFGIFIVTMRAMRRQQGREAADELARQRVAAEPPKTRVGLDFGVPTDERDEEGEVEERASRRRR